MAEEKNSANSVRQAVIEGCLEMAEIHLQIEREFYPLDEEVDRLIGDRLAEGDSEGVS